MSLHERGFNSLLEKNESKSGISKGKRNSQLYLRRFRSFNERPVNLQSFLSSVRLQLHLLPSRNEPHTSLL